MRSAVFAALLGSSAFVALSALAQAPSPPAGADAPAAAQPAAPPAPAAAPPTIAQPSAPAPAAAAQAIAQGGPADLCKELLAYAEKKAVEPPKPPAGQAAAPAAAPAPAQPAAAAQQPPAQQQPAAAPQGGAGQQAAATPRADGPATGTQGGGSVDRSTSANVASQQSAAPVSPATPGAAPEPAASAHAASSGAAQTTADGPGGEVKLPGGATLQQVRDTTGGGDRQACRDAAQKMRRAGADLPAALIALAAYDPSVAKKQ